MAEWSGIHRPPPRNKREKREREAEFEAWCEAERRRVAEQRAAFDAAVPPGPARDQLEKAMLDRAWSLLDAGLSGCEAADALLEWLPEAAGDKLLEEYFAEPEEGGT